MEDHTREQAEALSATRSTRRGGACLLGVTTRPASSARSDRGFRRRLRPQGRPAAGADPSPAADGQPLGSSSREQHVRMWPGDRDGREVSVRRVRS